MWKLDRKEAWAPIDGFMVLNCGDVKRLLRVLWTAKRSNQSILKDIFFGRTDAQAEAPILWPPDEKSRDIGKDLDAGKDWRLEETRATEDKMVGWHQQLNGHEFEQTQGDGEGQGSLVCCRSWVRKELDTTQLLNYNNNKLPLRYQSHWCWPAVPKGNFPLQWV